MFRIISIALLSLTLLITGCMFFMKPPADLNLSLSRLTDSQQYLVTLKPLAEPLPVNRIHAWEITLTSPTGTPITDANIAVDGGMPQHGHGFPTDPRVTRELGEGRYLIEGMKFSMTGWWEIELDVNASMGKDRITFNTIVEHPQVANGVADNGT